MGPSFFSIEKEARMLKPADRNTMYAHLAAHLPISKETLMKRARKLVTENLDERLRQPLSDLREGQSRVSLLKTKSLFSFNEF